MTWPPAVTVLIPSCRPALLVEAKESLNRQTRKDFQVLTNEYEESYLGKINDLAKIAQGKRLLQFHDDDKLREDFMELMLRAAEATDADIVYCNVELFGRASSHVARPPFTLEEFKQGPPCWISSLITKQLWDDIGGLDHSIGAYSDWALGYEAIKRGAKATHVQEPLFQHRIHDVQQSHDMDRAAARASFFGRYPELAVAA